jgi:sentrin-specific protease 8
MDAWYAPRTPTRTFLSVFACTFFSAYLPAHSQLTHAPADPRELLEGSGGALRHLTHASHIFCPINDNTDTSQAEGGTHWSLLVVGIQDRIAFHYDSLASCNHIPATAVHRMLERVLGFSLSFANLTDTPQQDNCMDCGVHVCWAMKHLLLRRLLLAERRTEVDMSLGGKRLNAQKLRREMYMIAESLRKRANRR